MYFIADVSIDGLKEDAEDYRYYTYGSSSDLHLIYTCGGMVLARHMYYSTSSLCENF